MKIPRKYFLFRRIYVKNALTKLRFRLALISNFKNTYKLMSNNSIYIDRLILIYQFLQIFSSRFLNLTSIIRCRSLYHLLKIDGDVFKYLYKYYGISINDIHEIDNFEEIITFDVKELFFENIYLKYGFHNSPKPLTIIDCGANIGLYSFLVSTQYQVKKIYAFEPSQAIYNLLCDNIKENYFADKIIPINCFLGRSKGSVCFDVNDDVFTMSKKSINDIGVDVAQVSIDSFISDEGISDIDIIKMDIEGGEYDAIAGASNTLKNMKPKLIISAYHLYDDIPKLTNKILDINSEYKIIVTHNSFIHPILYCF